MKDSDKNRCPVAAAKRAKSDARCALRKLGLLDDIEELDIDDKSVAIAIMKRIQEVIA
ncbi:MAG: hypothetical protein ACI88C_000013 [Acidimicrobiales bacterium]|jgi:hypothetical protein